MRNSAYNKAIIERLVVAIKALSDETRIRILNLILQRECCVCEVMQVLGISQTRASRNLSMLHNAGFLKFRKKGLWAYYSIDKSSLENQLGFLLEAVEIVTKDSSITTEDTVNLNKTSRLASRYCKKC
jgi:ArsR family transcriptional regulator, arsenate/arsenite/antimonite-responsive transcriptional repressor